jgi:hypothetical protein
VIQKSCRTETEQDEENEEGQDKAQDEYNLNEEMAAAPEGKPGKKAGKEKPSQAAANKLDSVEKDKPKK